MASWKDLTELKYIGEKSAKRLYKKGYITGSDILRADKKEIAKLIGPNAYKVFKENEPTPDPFKVLKNIFQSGLDLFKRFLKKKKGRFKIGIYGPANVGKTTLANRISMDCLGKEMGSVSKIPHAM